MAHLQTETIESKCHMLNAYEQNYEILNKLFTMVSWRAGLYFIFQMGNRAFNTPKHLSMTFSHSCIALLIQVMYVCYQYVRERDISRHDMAKEIQTCLCILHLPHITSLIQKTLSTLVI